MFFASLLAIVVASFLFFFVSLMLVGVVSLLIGGSREQEPVKAHSVLKITFDTPIEDYVSDNPVEYLDFATMQVRMPLRTMDVLAAIEKATYDDNIEAIYLEPSPLMPVGLANLQEIRGALELFRESGKKVFSYAPYYSQRSYYLASVADTVILNPQGELTWNGMQVQVMFFKGLLDKLGVEVEAVKHGKYKSAVEPFLLSGMSAENRQQNQLLVNSIWSDLVGGVAGARGIDSLTLQRCASDLSVNGAEDALRLGFVDTLLYKDGVISYLEEQYGKKYNVVGLGSYAKGVEPFATATGKKSGEIALIYACGDIIEGKSGEGYVGSETISRQIRSAREDDDVKAIVLRIDSPGGSALAAEIICHEVQLAQEQKPVVVSMGNYAASGGYYIAAPADVIVASDATVTGSIGVFGLMLNARNAFENKLGIRVETVRTNPSADMGSPFRPLSPEERTYMQKSVDRVYDTFVKRVAAGRNMSFEAVDRIAEGRVWSGQDAKKIGLVDEIGGVREAVLIAADKAGVMDNFRVTTTMDESDLYTRLLSLFEASAVKLTGSSDLFGLLKKSDAGVAYVKTLLGGSRVQAMMPYRMEIE